jgi:DNA-binding transcriptional LysR family regulator
MLPDHVVDLVMPPLLERIGAEAPRVRLDVTPWRSSTVMTVELARSIDLLIACTGEALAGFHRRHLFADTEAIAVRRDHAVGAGLERLDAFLEAGHAAVVAPGRLEDPIDTWLRDKGIVRRIALVVPSYLQALHMVARTDLVAFVPRRLIEALAGPLGLIAVSPPVDPGKYEEFMFYPARARVDRGSIWLRKHVIEIGRTLDRRKHRAA